ncbi:MAG: hypothetical protein ABI378_01320 [Chitinophagaceae bacterium]
MNKTEMVQSLWQRIKQPKHSMEQLTQIFAEYKAMVADFVSSGEDYREALLHTHEEFPDLQRLVGKGHDAVLKGRLVDAISSLKKKVAKLSGEVEEPIVAEEIVMPETQSVVDSAVDISENKEPEVKPKFRITPSLGMD